MKKAGTGKRETGNGSNRSRTSGARRGASACAVSTFPVSRFPFPGLLAVGLLFAPTSAGSAHDIPATVVVRAFVKPEGSRLRLLVRVPLQAMRDIKFPVRDPGYLELAGLDPLLRDAANLWISGSIELFEGDVRLGNPQVLSARVSLPSDVSFRSYDAALEHLGAPPLPDNTELIWQQALLDVWLEYPIASAAARFSIRPALAHLGLRTTTVLRFLAPGRPERAFEYAGDPGLVRLDPRWHQAAGSFVKLGFEHILSGFDHLLFLLCLLIPFRRFRSLLVLITSFTIAHSITLIASATGLAPGVLWFPPLIETLIAMSVLYMALENIVGAELKRRWLVAFGFGLVHGFGFSFALRQSLQFSGSHLITSLLGFNLGVELGQLLVIVLAIPMLNVLFRYAVRERLGTILLSALVAHTAWHWMTSRASVLKGYDLEWPAFDLSLLASLMRGAMLVLILAGALWVLYGIVGRLRWREPEGEVVTGFESGAATPGERWLPAGKPLFSVSRFPFPVSSRQRK